MQNIALRFSALTRGPAPLNVGAGVIPFAAPGVVPSVEGGTHILFQNVDFIDTLRSR
jgi:hypothetical protein